MKKENIMLDIGIKLREHELSTRLHQLSFEDKKNSGVIDILKRLEKESLFAKIPFDKISITTNELKGINITQITNNTELLARWYDLFQHLGIAPKESSCSAYKLYMQLYNESCEYQYALRAFMIVKSKKGIFKGDLIDIIDKSIEVLESIKRPNSYKRIVEQISNLNKKVYVCQKIELSIKKRIDLSVKAKQFNDARVYVETLEEIDSISKIECRKWKSNLFEQEGDNLVANKKENTYYPAIVKCYKTALAEIRSLAGTDSDIIRISDKYFAESKELNTGIGLFGIGTSQKISSADIYTEIVQKWQINNPYSAWAVLVNFPLLSNSYLEKRRNKSKDENEMLYKSFSKHVWQNSRGLVTNIKDGDEAIDDSNRRLFQDLSIQYLLVLKYIMNTTDECSIDIPFIEKRLIDINSKFIPKERVIIFAQGVYIGLMGDYSLSSHILLPQIENSFRHIAQQHCIITSKVSEEIQHDKTMGVVLEKIKPYTNSDVWSELYHFLVDGVNFRNETMHGLLSHQQLNYHGLYLWWLCIKMIFHTDEYFFEQ